MQIQTSPGARCTLSGWPGSAFFYADAKGRVGFTVAATDSAAPVKTQMIDCVTAGLTQSIPLTLTHISGRAAPQTPPIATTTPVSFIDIASANARFGIDITSATEQQLLAHDLPPRPSDPDAYQRWLRAVVRPFTEVVHVGVDEPEVSHALPQGLVRSGSTGGITVGYVSKNWDGFAAPDPQYTWKLVQGQWFVPTLNLSVDSTNGDTAAEWVGIDGFTSGSYPSYDLIQDGTNSIVTYSGGYAVASYYMWYEYIPQSLHLAFYLQPNDFVDCEAWAATPTSSTTAGEYWCEDANTGQVMSTSLANQGTAFKGTSAEWIVERVTVNGSLTGLADFNNAYGYTQMQEPEATYTSTGQTVAASTLSLGQITMNGTSGDALATAAFKQNRCTYSPCYPTFAYTWEARY